MTASITVTGIPSAFFDNREGIAHPDNAMQLRVCPLHGKKCTLRYLLALWMPQITRQSGYYRDELGNLTSHSNTNIIVTKLGNCTSHFAV